MSHTTEDHDSPWKEALECFFQPFLQLLFPDLHQAIDWTRPVTFLNTELQKLTPASQTGKRHADKLVQVWFRDQCQRWLLIHVEVQGHQDARFPERMFVYYLRIRDHHNKQVVSLAVLTDTAPNYRPEHFEEHVAGSGVYFRFRTVKLLDYRARMDELLTSDNPFALLVAAQLTAKLEKDGKRRVDSLIGFYRLAIHKQWDRQLVSRLLVFLDWLIAFPPEARIYYTAQVDRLKEETAMPYVSMLEQIGTERGLAKGIEQGLQEGRQQGLHQGRATLLLHLLQLKFGELPEALQQRVTHASEAELNLWAERILSADTLDQVIS